MFRKTTDGFSIPTIYIWFQKNKRYVFKKIGKHYHYDGWYNPNLNSIY